ncbi:helix-turn-helix domain-containing protein [Sphingomonas arenae]|uniref:helix-turn-helix domain-containing protein n=1 Tax=Sphingomonas arenae TaxID=2812555 RepID=UPI0019682E10|nr:RodZ domain-containing protein [Sphingomonas arenae]
MAEIEAGTEATVGERLRAARESQGLSLEDIAARTRIPTRHLESLEAGEWDRLPAPTYSLGFAKSYASAVGLDRTEIGDRLREEMGGTRRAAAVHEVYEPADPARVMPKWLVIAAIVGVVAVVAALLFLRQRELSEPGETPAAAVESPVAVSGAQNPAATATPSTAAPSGPVVITANEPVWIQVTERAGPRLFEGELRAGQSFQVPTDAKAPLLRTGKPEALRISVGTADAPPVGPAATTVRDVSLLAADLMRSGGATPANPAAGAQR